MTVTEPVVGAVLGIVVLGETLQTGEYRLFALVAAFLAVVAATAALARSEAVATGSPKDSDRRSAQSSEPSVPRLGARR